MNYLDRLRRWEDGDNPYYGTDDDTSPESDRAEASRELLRLTDPTPIDEPWLYTLGFTKDGMCKRATLQTKHATLYWWNPGGTLELQTDGEPQTFPITTRGELRSLAQLLKIEFKEEA